MVRAIAERSPSMFRPIRHAVRHNSSRFQSATEVRAMMNRQRVNRSTDSKQRGFTLLEAAIALVVLMIIGLGIASLFTYAIKANGRADDRELAMAIVQKRMEWMRTIPFTTQTRNQPFSFPDGGLQPTAPQGANENVTNAGRGYLINTIITDISFVPAGQP